MANEKTISENLAHLLEELGLTEETITIKSTSQNLIREKEVYEFIRAVQEAHE